MKPKPSRGVVANAAIAPSRVPRRFAPSAHCVELPAGNTHLFPNGVLIHEGEALIFDLDACPKHGDLVLIWRDGRTPCVRCCEIAPIAEAPRDQWAMGVFEDDRETIVIIDLRTVDRIGVCTGIRSVDGEWRHVEPTNGGHAGPGH